MPAETSPVEPSRTTQLLIDLLRERDRRGRATYGVSLDRSDLQYADWCQHIIEELLDAAGYAARIRDTLPRLRALELRFRMLADQHRAGAMASTSPADVFTRCADEIAGMLIPPSA